MAESVGGVESPFVDGLAEYNAYLPGGAELSIQMKRIVQFPVWDECGGGGWLATKINANLFKNAY